MLLTSNLIVLSTGTILNTGTPEAGACGRAGDAVNAQAAAQSISNHIFIPSHLRTRSNASLYAIVNDHSGSASPLIFCEARRLVFNSQR